jgi:hypothetical protein
MQISQKCPVRKYRISLGKRLIPILSVLLSSSGAIADQIKCQELRNNSQPSPQSLFDSVSDFTPPTDRNATDAQKYGKIFSEIRSFSNELSKSLKEHKVFSRLSIDCIEEQSAEINRLDKVLSAVTEKSKQTIAMLDGES